MSLDSIKPQINTNEMVTIRTIGLTQRCKGTEKSDM